MWQIHISHSGADPHMRRNSVIHCVVDPQVKQMRSVVQTATENRQTMPTEALRHVQFFKA